MTKYAIIETTIDAKTGDVVADCELKAASRKVDAVAEVEDMVDGGYLREMYESEASGNLRGHRYAYGIEVHELDDEGYFEDVVYSARYGAAEHNAEQEA